jgi:hypothetical protein
MIVNFHSDAGHGWLEVDIADLKAYGIEDEISSYSYIKGDKAYLEEDRDASLYLRKLEEAGIIPRFHEFYRDHSPIRNYNSYPTYAQA